MKANIDEPIHGVLEALANVHKTTKGWSARCPAHDDHNNSLSVGTGNKGQILLKCFAGCEAKEIVEALGLEMADLFASCKGKQHEIATRGHGLTLEEYAAAKQLPVEFLKSLGLSEIYRTGKPAVSIPYYGLDDASPTSRFRLSLTLEPRFVWKAKSKPSLYGIWRLDRVQKPKYICLVEGESDAHTLWFHHFPAVGLAGATLWKEEWAGLFDGIDRIYVFLEPDRGGEAVLKWLTNSGIRDRARLIRLDGFKDPSELYLADPENFTRAWKRAMKAAVPWAEEEKKEAIARAQAAWEKCKQLASEPDILKSFEAAMAKRGLVGEARAIKLLYLSLNSRFLDRPVSAVMMAPRNQGRSSATAWAIR